ncbi:MAG: DsbA family protein [Candidatus Pacearchaeota archaeon]|jgi:protein-disulfide isomerase
MDETKKSKDSINIEKRSLWKYATFILAIAVIILVIFLVRANITNKSIENINNEVVEEVNMNVFLENSEIYPSIGPKNSENVVIEFSDFQCPYCAISSGLPDFAKQYETQYSELFGSSEMLQEKAKAGELRFIYVPMSFLGQESVYAAEAGLCANQQGKFWEMHDLIFSAHDGKENNGKFSKENLKQMASNIQGLDTNKFNNCLDNDETLSDVQEVASVASQFVSGTPSFFVNGQQVSASKTQILQALK